MKHIKRIPLRMATLFSVFILGFMMSGGAASATPHIIAKSSSCTTQIIKHSDRGGCVKQVQQRLIEDGQSLGRYGADGIFGKLTDRAVKNYQKKHRLTIDGIVGPQTWRQLTKSSGGGSDTCSSQIIKSGARGQCAEKVQSLLKRNGEWLGTSGVDGIFGSVSDQAVRHYQQRYGLAEDGIVGPKTWTQLASGKVKTSHLDKSCFSSGTWTCVDKSDMITYVLQDGKLIRQMASRTGGSHEFRGEWLQHDTPNGAFDVLNRVIDEESGLYDDSPMPHSQYFTNAGHAFHGSPDFTTHGNYINAKASNKAVVAAST